MSSFSSLKTAITNAIKQNGNQEITGNLLQGILLSIVETLGDSAINTLETGLSNEAATRGNADTDLNNLITGVKNNVDNGYVYAGIAIPTTSPVSGKVFYIATKAGTYTNLGGLSVTEGITILKYNGSTWSKEQVIYGDGGVYDVTAQNGGATFASLEALLGSDSLSTLIPTAVRKGGMSIKFVRTSDNNYMQYRCMANEFTTDVTQWQGVDDKLIAESKDIVTGGAIWNKTTIIDGEFMGKSCQSLVFTPGYYYNVNTIGSTVTDMTPASSPKTKCAMVSCSPGDVFIINGKGAENGRLYAILDSDKKVLRNAVANLAREYSLLFIEDGAAYVVFNLVRENDIVYKGISNIHSINLGIHGTLFTTQYSDGGTFSYNFIQGKKYLIKYIEGSNNVTVSLRDVGSDTTKQSIGALKPNNYIEFTASVNATGIRYGSNTVGTSFLICEDGSVPYQIVLSEQKTETNYKQHIDGLGWEQKDGFVFTTTSYAKNYPYTIVKGQTYIMELIEGSVGEKNTVNMTTYDLANSVVVESLGQIIDARYPQRKFVFVASENATAFRHGANGRSGLVIRVRKVNSEEVVNKLIQPIYNIPMVSFEIPHELINVESYMQDIDFTGKHEDEYYNFPTTLQTKFDALVAEHSSDIEKIDLAEYVDEAYPSYTSLNGQASGSYLPTPSYQTWMYRIHSDKYVPTSQFNSKRKLLLIGGTHGGEIGAQFNLFVLASRLLNEYLTDINLFKLRMAYDIYIIPILDSYGSYHRTRVNANGVNINRNYYVGTYSGSLQPGDNNYPGAVGCGEFESKLVIKLTDMLKPDEAFDCHSNVDYPFYTNISETPFLKPAFDALADLSFTLKNEYPNDFGDDCSILKTANDAPWNPMPKGWDGTATTARWWSIGNGEHKPNIAATLETDQGINYSNGDYTSSFREQFSAKALSIAEYALRIQLLRYIQYSMENCYMVQTSQLRNGRYLY